MLNLTWWVLFCFFVFGILKQYAQQTFDVDVVVIVVVVRFGQWKPLIFCFVIPKIQSEKDTKWNWSPTQHNTFSFPFVLKRKKCSVSISNSLSHPLSSKSSKHTSFFLFFFVFVGWACFWVSLFSKDLFCLFEQGHHISNGFHTKFLQPSLCFTLTCFRSTKHYHIFAIHSLFTKSSCITSQLWIHFQPISNFLNSPLRRWFGVSSLWLIRWVTVNAAKLAYFFIVWHNFVSVLVDKLVFVWLIGWSWIRLLVKLTRIAGHHITTTFCLLIIKIMFKLERKHQTKTYNCISAAGGDSWTWKLWMNKNKTKTKSHNK